MSCTGGGRAGRVDLIIRASDLLNPLFEQEEFKCAEWEADNIYWFLKRIDNDGKFSLEDRPPRGIDLGQTFGRRGQFRETVVAAFKFAFGENYNIDELVEGILSIAMCSFSSTETTKGTISPDDLEKAKTFFRVWKKEIEKILSENYVQELRQHSMP